MTLKLLIKTPSSARFVENGGMEPGVMPPISAWWAREAVKKRGVGGRESGVGGCGVEEDCGLRISDCGLEAGDCKLLIASCKLSPPSPGCATGQPASPDRRWMKTGVMTVM